MRYLLCSLDSLGMLYPVIGIARELQRRGHTVACVTDMGRAGLLEQAGVARIPRTEVDGMSFQVVRWWHELEVALQIRHLDHAIATFRPDVLVGQALALGPLIAAEQHGLPLVNLGLATYLWPTSAAAPRSEPEERRLARYQEMLGYYNRARALLQLPACAPPPEQNPFLGDLFLLQSVPAATPARAALPERVRLVGACTWEPPAADAELEAWLAQAAERGGPLLYAQPGRSFRAPTFWSALAQTLRGQPVWVAASLDRMPGQSEPLPATFFARQHVPQGQVLPHARAVVANGNTTAALGALTHGLPALLIPGGGEQPDMAELCQELGAALVLPFEQASPARLGVLLTGLLARDDLRRAAQALQAAFRQIDGPSAAAGWIESLRA